MSPTCSPPVPRLRVRTVAVDATGDLLTRIPDETDPAEVVTWLREGDGLVGWGRVAHHESLGTARFDDAEAWWTALCERADVADEVRLPGTGLVAFGSFAFSADSTDASVLTVPRILIGRRDGLAWITRVSLAEGEETPQEVADGQDHPADVLARTNPRLDELDPVVEEPGHVPAPDWPGVVGRAVERIVAGEVDKVVLARDVTVRHRDGGTVRVAPVVERLSRRYAATWTFAVDGLVGATPEMLVRLQAGRARSRVLAGTMRRTEDRARLVRSEKDLGEHDYAVRSVAEALAPYCDDLVVPTEPYALELPDVYHLASDLSGTMRSGATSLRLAAALHPSAAVCGTPTGDAAALIAELEGMDRGRYAGPVGWMDGSGDGDWGIALRCGELADDRRSLRLFAGGGIVAASDPEAELAETEVKLTAMRHALGLTEAG